MTIAITTNAYHVACTEVGRSPTRCVIARHAMKPLAATRMAASASAERCSALPWPYWWDTSAGRTATPTANSVSSAATRSVPECSASEISPRLCDARPAPSLSAMSRMAATTETSAALRCGCIRLVKRKSPPRRALRRSFVPKSYELAMSPWKLSLSVVPEPFPRSCQWRTISRGRFPLRFGAV